MEANIELIVLNVTDDEAKELGLSEDEVRENGDVIKHFRVFDGFAVECDDNGVVPKDPIIMSFPTVETIHEFREINEKLANWCKVRVDKIEPIHSCQYFCQFVRLSKLLTSTEMFN